MVGEILVPTVAVPQLDMVSDADKCNTVFQTGPFSQAFVQEQSSLGIEFDFACECKTHSFEGDGLIGCGGVWRDGKGYLFEIFFRIEAKNAVCAEDEVEAAAMFFAVNLVSEFVRDEDSAFGVNYVLVFTC